MAGYPYQRLLDTLLVPLQSVTYGGRVNLRPRDKRSVVLALVAPFAVVGLAFCVRVVSQSEQAAIMVRRADNTSVDGPVPQTSRKVLCTAPILRHLTYTAHDLDSLSYSQGRPSAAGST